MRWKLDIHNSQNEHENPDCIHDNENDYVHKIKKAYGYWEYCIDILKIFHAFLKACHKPGDIVIVNMVAWNVDSDKHSIVVSVIGFICKSHDQDCEHVAYEE